MALQTQWTIAAPLSPAGYIWHPTPFNVWVSVQPHNALQAHVLDELRRRLEANGCVFVHSPTQQTNLGAGAQLGIVFGRSLEEEISPLTYLGQLPKPRGTMLIINAVASIPDLPLFDLARGQLVRKGAHIGILIEGDLDRSEVKRALWASMAGNNRLLERDEASLLDAVALRVQAHVGAEKINIHTGDASTGMTWADWRGSLIHDDIAEAAHRLGAAGIIEDEVPLWRYGTNGQVRSVLRFLQRAALGEGMRSQLDLDLQVMGVTTSGGNKINVSADPADGHVVPISHLTWTGYVRAVPGDYSARYINPSVETHENGMIYLASALVNAGLINGFDGFLRYVRDYFAKHERIHIVPPGTSPKITAIDHFHRQPRPGSVKDPQRVEIVYPDARRFPEIDFPCGVREAELHLLSAAFQSRLFTGHEPLGGRAIIAVLPGHGSVAMYGGPREELTDLLTRGMEMEEIVRI